MYLCIFVFFVARVVCAHVAADSDSRSATEIAMKSAKRAGERSPKQ